MYTSTDHWNATGISYWSVGYPTYQSPLSRIFRAYHVFYHMYADDSQTYVFLKPSDGDIAKDQMESCIADSSTWMHDNHLKLNHSNTEYVIIGTKHGLQQAQHVSSIQFGNITMESSKSVKNTGAIFDSQLSMVGQVGATCRLCYVHIRNIRKIRPYLSQAATE